MRADPSVDDSGGDDDANSRLVCAHDELLGNRAGLQTPFVAEDKIKDCLCKYLSPQELIY